MSHPPAWARWLLHRAVDPLHRDAVVGDLEEEFFEHVLPERGARAARRWYRRQVLRSLTPLARAHLRRRLDARRHNGRRESRVFTFVQDLRFSLRAIRKNLGFASVVILTVGLGIGANTILYSVVDGLILNPFPFPNADRLIAVGTEYPRLGRSLTFIEHISPPEYVDIRDQSQTLEEIVAWDMGNRQVSYGDLTENVFTGFWWGDGFQAIGMSALRGRGMSLEETVRGDPVAVISHRLWQSRFGEDPDLVGADILINGNAYTVIGIMPPRVVLNGMDLWIPMGVGPEVIPRQRRQWQVIARLQDGFTLDEANAELEALARRTEQAYTAEHEEYAGWHLRALTYTDANVRTFKTAGYVLLGAVAFVLLIVCANVASLLLARSATRRREMAVRTAMGAGRGRLVRQVLTESVSMAATGGLIGIALAWVGTRAVADILANFPFLPGTVELNARVLAFCAFVSVAAGVLFGIVPALQASGSDIRGALQAEGAGTTGSARRLRLQKAFVGVEVALALVLLAGGGLLLNSMLRLNRTDTGFQPEGVMTMRLTLPWEDYDGPAIGAFFQSLEEEVLAIPGVEAVGRGAQYPPIAFSFERVATEGAEVTDEGQLPVAMTTLASPGYFDALGIPLRQGRVFDDRDGEGAPFVAVINEAAAGLLFEDRQAVGERFRAGADEGDPWFEVIGVVGNTVNNGLDQPPFPEVFANHGQVPGWSNQMFLLVRTAVEPYSVVPAVRAAVQSLDRDQPVYAIRTVEETLAVGIAPRRIAARVLGVFAGFALLLASVGIFSVVAFAVGERTREIGLRVALGAVGSEVRSLVIRQALAPVLIGALVGLGVALALGRLVGGLLYEVSGTDPLTLTGVTLTLALVALVAGWIPATRASRLDPVQALRND